MCGHRGFLPSIFSVMFRGGMAMWNGIRRGKEREKAIEAQIKNIEQLNRHLPTYYPDLAEWGFMPEEVSALKQAEQWLLVLKTEDFRHKALKYGVDMPDIADETMYSRMDWNDDQDEPYYLTSKGFRQIRMDIRAEDDYRWNKWNTRIAIATGPLGVIVAIVALVFGK
jgi:hypothetical protein